MEMSSLETNMETKPNKGKRKRIEIKKVEQANRRHVTFSKRKLGLFNKLTELSILCQTETALIVTSQNGKFYSCGYPDADAVVRRYQTGGPQCGSRKKQTESIETLRLEYEAIQNDLQEKKKRLKEITETEKSGVVVGSPSWWNQGIEDMSLDNLEEFKASLERLKLNLVAAVQEEKFSSLPPPMPLAIFSQQLQEEKFSSLSQPMPLAIFSQQQLPMPNVPLLAQYPVQDYCWGKDASTSSSVLPRSKLEFGHYQ